MSRQNIETIHTAEDIPIVHETDICILGGSCTGVFAAVRAARLGARTTIIEKQGHFGGVATITCTWHNLFDTVYKRQIISGLTEEVITRLQKRRAVNMIYDDPNKGFEFRPGDLKIVLDDMIVEAKTKPFLHTLFTAPVVRDGKLIGVIIENKSGRGVILAKHFVDATGDGDLCARLGLEQYRYESLLPPTTCAFVDQWTKDLKVNLGEAVTKYGSNYGLEQGFIWGSILPETDICMLAGTRIRNVDCSNGTDLSNAEIEGRRQVKGIIDLLNDKHPELGIALHDFPSSIGIRDTRHIRCLYQLTEDDVLNGRRFDDAIANGSYRVDTHHQDKPGITFKYLDGQMRYVRPGVPDEKGWWREKTDINPTFYQVPFRSLIPGSYPNLILAGRMLDADKTAFSAVRVMVNTNQMGEAAGTAAYLALSANQPITSIDARNVRSTLEKGGSIII
jgi:hypothetical protein